MMGSKASKLMATGLAATVLAAVPAGAAASVDYSKNSVNGQYQASPAKQRLNHLDYSRNSVNGENNVATLSSPGPTQVARSSTASIDRRSPAARHAAKGIGVPPVPVADTGSSGGFHWGDAGIGAGAVILLTLVVGIGGTLLPGRRTGSRIAN